MVNKLKELRSNGAEEGFTLIELMIVVVIIGILAAIAIPLFANQQKNAIDAGVKSDVKNTVTAISTDLVKKPTADATAFAALPSVTELATKTWSDEGTTVTATGTWEAYTVTGKNGNGTTDGAKSSTGYVYSSTTGKIKP